ncbi:unnamed protein product [Rotaria magnacalcarata]|uniref:Cyclin-dependent kinase 5 activator n=1 Tax=Rotaria magnacalcarata TaxID=392030 RepID=A0A819HH79_9BILA|nr:unnamed protein product [Rotaria magnacalcarata]CAF1663712.1 unnamed protein product [Rotaria magnacalcarata]CAF1954220.1 unnamed protein product [Rotaria magnacalcarata]CAF2060815.1 unnamed protein product [Rotaria magnacalcarata]CAF2117801.1 unnamed protein product [Rotaria magnacalcarata]
MGNVSPRQSKSCHDELNNHISLSSSSSSTTTTATSSTPSRSSWKKQLQIINESLNFKKFSIRHTHGRSKRYRTNVEENNHRKLSTSMTTQNFHDLIKSNREKSNKENDNSKMSQQENRERETSFKKSFSLFSIKQPLADSTNKRIMTKSINNTTTNIKDNEEDHHNHQHHHYHHHHHYQQQQTQQQQQSSLNSKTKSTNNLIAQKQQESSPTQENQTVDAFSQHKRRHKYEIRTVSNVLINKRYSAFIPQSYHLPKSQSQYYQQSQLSSYAKVNNSLSSSSKNIRTIEKNTSHKTIIQASTNELLRCLGDYLCSCCPHLLPILDSTDCILWIKSADRQLILQGWQEQVFVNPANIVFVYLLLRETLTYVVPSTTIKSVTELHAIILTCLYLAFSYMGNEITYPLKPFVTDDETREAFWQRVVLIMGQLSSKMLAINQNPKFFTECFSELKTHNLVR